MPIINDITNPNATAPVLTEYTPNLYGTCPDYENVPNCCNQYTMTALNSNYQILDNTFGSPQVGCSICSANLRRFWCKFNCDPGQDSFITPGSAAYMNYTVDPSDPDDQIEVLTYNVTLNSNSTCALFTSCKDVDFTKALGSMKTYQGLWSVFAQQAITQGNVLMNFSYASEAGLTTNVNACNMVFNGSVDQYNYTLNGGIGWCSCQHCSSNCSNAIDWSQYIEERTILGGADWQQVGKTALLSLLVIIVGAIIKTVRNNKGKGEIVLVADENDPHAKPRRMSNLWTKEELTTE